MLDVELHDKQIEVYEDTHRFRVICAGRRWGKSVLSQIVILDWATKQSGLYWIVSPTYKQAKQIHWRQLTAVIPRTWVAKKNEVDLSITLVNGSIIELKGAENPDALRGVKLRGLVIDEIASIRNWDWLWNEVLRATLTDYAASAIFISTPKGYNHFYELFLLGQRNGGGASSSANTQHGDESVSGQSDYKSWRFTSYDNPYIPHEEIDKAKAELTEDTFAQEYLADFRKFTGLVYKEFDREIHVIEPFDVPESWSVFRGVDFGSTNPTVFLWIAVDGDDNWYLVDEHYSTEQTIDYHAGVVNANRFSGRTTSTYGDPSGAQWISEFAQRGIYITPANKEIGQAFNTWVTFGIDKVAQKLKVIPGHRIPALSESGGGYGSVQGAPSLFVFSHCQNTIREFETYRWKEKAVTAAQDLNQPDVVEKANDHAMDALRYFAVSYQKQEYIPVISDQRNWRIGA